jgi:hypothetical protein
VLKDSFAKTLILKVNSYVFVDVLNVASQPPSPIWKKDNRVNNFEEEYNRRMDEISKSSHIVEDGDENSKLQEENFNLLLAPPFFFPFRVGFESRYDPCAQTCEVRYVTP